MIKQEIIEKIKKSIQCRNALQYALKKGDLAMRRYLETNHIILTTKIAIEVICKELGVNESEIFEN